jgi:hypothetical protein
LLRWIYVIEVRRRQALAFEKSRGDSKQHCHARKLVMKELRAAAAS